MLFSFDCFVLFCFWLPTPQYRKKYTTRNRIYVLNLHHYSYQLNWLFVECSKSWRILSRKLINQKNPKELAYIWFRSKQIPISLRKCLSMLTHHCAFRSIKGRLTYFQNQRRRVVRTEFQFVVCAQPCRQANQTSYWNIKCLRLLLIHRKANSTISYSYCLSRLHTHSSMPAQHMLVPFLPLSRRHTNKRTQKIYQSGPSCVTNDVKYTQYNAHKMNAQDWWMGWTDGWFLGRL